MTQWSSKDKLEPAITDGKEEEKQGCEHKKEESGDISPFYVQPETLRFSKTLSDQEISPSGLTATCKNKNSEKLCHFYSNFPFKRGIHYWEIICPISCSGIEFGVKKMETNENILVSFRTTTPRVVGVRLD